MQFMALVIVSFNCKYKSIAMVAKHIIMHRAELKISTLRTCRLPLMCNPACDHVLKNFIVIRKKVIDKQYHWETVLSIS